MGETVDMTNLSPREVRLIKYVISRVRRSRSSSRSTSRPLGSFVHITCGDYLCAIRGWSLGLWSGDDRMGRLRDAHGVGVDPHVAIRADVGGLRVGGLDYADPPADRRPTRTRTARSHRQRSPRSSASTCATFAGLSRAPDPVHQVGPPAALRPDRDPGMDRREPTFARRAPRSTVSCLRARVRFHHRSSTGRLAASGCLLPTHHRHR